MLKCLFCGSTDIKNAAYPRPTIFNGKTFLYKHCRNCDLVFIDPIPSEEDYRVMYSAEYHSQFYFKDVAPDHSPLFELLEKHVSEKTIVDYGCGDGSFLKYFQSRGYSCTGVEYDPQLVRQLSEQNPGMRFITVADFWLQSDLKFGLAYMGDVLEHLATPAEILVKLQLKLIEGGLVMAQGPLENNTNLALGLRKVTSSMVALAGRKRATHTPYHISFSNVKNQEMIFKNAGYTTLEYTQQATNWPYPSTFSPRPLAKFQYVAATVSKAITRITGGRSGNRFIYIGRKNN